MRTEDPPQLRLDGAKFAAELPQGFDERTRLALTADGHVVVVHPEHPPVILEVDPRAP